jgi:hypothetical protein
MPLDSSIRRRVILITISVVVMCAAVLTAWLIFFPRPLILPQSTAPLSWTALASFVDSGVAVEIGVQREVSGSIWLAGRFSPDRAGFHLYSKDLPREGIEGLGYPTVLGITTPGALQSSGPLTADKQVIIQRIEILNQSFPIYPDGPVTLRMPVRLASDETAPTELSISYMACSPGTCLPPVIDKRILVRLPSTLTK